ALVPELDEFLPPAEAAAGFAIVPKAQVIAFPDEKHLWVGERATRSVLDQIAEITVPGSAPLPTSF
ncbi:MAG: alpha/beta hydrolase, partial [Micrococcales bacterium]|nr:alpha/beta hydrolase [Micrococcales bacterium]